MNPTAPAILAIDAATGPCSVAFLRGDEARVLRESESRKSARMMVPMIEQVMRESGCDYNDLSLIAVTVGPGSFTGLRIGIAAARGIGFAAQVPVYGVSTLSCLAWRALHAFPDAYEATVTLPAGKGEMYGQRFRLRPEITALSEPEITLWHTLSSHAPLIGSAAGNPPPQGFHSAEPDAEAAACIAQHCPALLLTAEPLYIRPPDAKIPCASA